MTPARRIGILGGTFDPIHCGHIDLARAAERTLDLTDFVVVTANVPPHRPQPLASSADRFAMVSLAVAAHRGWRASDVELRSSGPSYTSTTLTGFRDQGYDSSELFFVIGADAFGDIAAWRDYPAILDAAHFVVVSRPGFPVTELPRRLPALANRMVIPPANAPATSHPLIILIDARTADVSSTAIRQRIGNRDSIVGMVPPPVEQYIEQHGLYASTPSATRRADAPQHPAAGRLHGED
jgi:nicotinate-nucleotide adenylyltransferase